jgi:Rhodopirellula transposase DDE domain
MHHATSIPALRAKFEALQPVMDERVRRQWAATEALALGYGGISAVAAATGLARNTIAAGIAELRQRTDDYEPTPSIRRPGAGRKPLTTLDPELLHALDRLVDPATRGDPDSPLRWTCKSTRKLADELTRQGHPVSDRTVAHLLRQTGYSLQANRKTREGGRHPDRNAQFAYLNDQARRRQQRGQPVISVDTKKKELVGDFRNGGREWQPAGQPEEVRIHDFQDKELGKAIPYGVYDVTNNQGWVSVGITHDTAYFAVAAIRRWWQRMGAARFPRAAGILITADGGGSNGVRTRLWKVALQVLADELGLALSVCHFPPGTSKWNKIEHRLFCHITQNWRGRPLVSREAIVSLIGKTTTGAGLRVEAELDTNDYPTGIKVTDEELAALNLKRAAFHGEWNYTISPRK